MGLVTQELTAVKIEQFCKYRHENSQQPTTTTTWDKSQTTHALHAYHAIFNQSESVLVAWQLGEGFFEVVAINRVVAYLAHAQCRFTSTPGRVDGFLEDGIDIHIGG